MTDDKTPNLQQLVNNILTQTDYNTSCRGLQAIDSANKIAKHYFAVEGLSLEGWKVREIPVVDNSGKYPVSVVICVYNEGKNTGLDLCLTNIGKLTFCTVVYGNVEVEVSTIREAINYPAKM